MKLRILWGLSLAWALFFYYLGYGRLVHSWVAEGSIFNRGDKLEAFLAGIGGVAVGSFPAYITYHIQRFHKKRERGRLEKEMKRIDKKIHKIDRRQALSKDLPAQTDPGGKLDGA